MECRRLPRATAPGQAREPCQELVLWLRQFVSRGTWAPSSQEDEAKDPRQGLRDARRRLARKAETRGKANRARNEPDFWAKGGRGILSVCGGQFPPRSARNSLVPWKLTGIRRQEAGATRYGLEEFRRIQGRRIGATWGKWAGGGGRTGDHVQWAGFAPCWGQAASPLHSEDGVAHVSDGRDSAPVPSQAGGDPGGSSVLWTLIDY